jgi:hypothetical protein
VSNVSETSTGENIGWRNRTTAPMDFLQVFGSLSFLETDGRQLCRENGRCRFVKPASEAALGTAPQSRSTASLSHICQFNEDSLFYQRVQLQGECKRMPHDHDRHQHQLSSDIYITIVPLVVSDGVRISYIQTQSSNICMQTQLCHSLPSRHD